MKTIKDLKNSLSMISFLEDVKIEIYSRERDYDTFNNGFKSIKDFMNDKSIDNIKLNDEYDQPVNIFNVNGDMWIDIFVL